MTFSHITHNFHPRISTSMNMDLTRPITREEIKQATFSIHPFKALSKEGLIGLFFQKYWSIIGNDICDIVQSFFCKW